MRPSLLLTAGLLLAACGGTPPPTSEDLALRTCTAELRERLGLAQDATTSQAQMIGRREYGWLVRGLSRELPVTGAQSYECRLDDDGSGPPRLTSLRLCAAGPSPYGCPAPSP